jgi:hypothetical protein
LEEADTKIYIRPALTPLTDKHNYFNDRNCKVCTLPFPDPDLGIVLTGRAGSYHKVGHHSGGLFAFGKFDTFADMKQTLFRILARLNKWLLPSYSKKRLDLSKASKIQMAIIGWRYYVTTRALG